MIPPTPSPMPFGTPIPLDVSSIGDATDMWNVGPQVVGLWNMLSDYTPILQWVFVGLIVLLLVWMIAGLLRSMSEDDVA